MLLGILTIGLVLRVPGLGARSLWLDEAMTASLLEFSPIEIVRRCAEPKSIHPPLYYVAIRCWSAVVGGSEAALRGFSLAMGILTILGVYLIVRELERLPGSEPTESIVAPALFAALLVALSPMQIELSRTARGYALEMACITFSGWAMLRGLRNQCRLGNWVAATFLAVAACYAHYIATLSVLAGAMFGVVYLARDFAAGRSAAEPAPGSKSVTGYNGLPVLWGPAVAGLLLVFAFLPWLPNLAIQSETVRHHSYKSPISLADCLDQVTMALYSTYDTSWQVPQEARWLSGGLLVTLFVYLAVRGGWRRWFLVATGLVPLILLVTFSLTSDRSIVHARYLCIAHLLGWPSCPCDSRHSRPRIGNHPRKLLGRILCLVLLRQQRNPLGSAPSWYARSSQANHRE